LGDEYHYIFECTEFINERKLYFDFVHINRHNIFKYKEIYNNQSIIKIKIKQQKPDPQKLWEKPSLKCNCNHSYCKNIVGEQVEIKHLKERLLEYIKIRELFRHFRR
jgi:hypothetical protein